MCVLLFDVFKHFTIEKKWRPQNLSQKKKNLKENLKKCTIFEEQKGARYIRENVFFWHIIFSCFSSTKLCLRFLLHYFFREIKGFYQSSFGNEINFRDIMNVSPNILAKNSNFKNLRHGFVDESALTTTTYTSSCHWRSLVPFWLRKKRPENAFLTLIVNYRKIMQKNKLSFKTTVNRLFNDIWCYLVIGCSDWQIGVFQPTVVRRLLCP